MKTPKKKTDKEEKKEGGKSEKTENIVAIAIFVLLIIVGMAIFTKGFGLFEESDDSVRISVPLGKDPFTGNTNASVVIIAFSGYECPFCAKAEETMQAILEKYENDVVYIFKDFPLTKIHPNAQNASLAAECAKEHDKFWDYHNYLYEHNNQLSAAYLIEYAGELGLDTEEFKECLETQRYKKEVDKDIQTGRQVGVTGTPTFFINGIKVVGAKPESEFTKIINSELKTKR